MTAAQGEMAGGRGGDGGGLFTPAPNVLAKVVSGTIPVRRRAGEARKDLKPSRKLLKDPRDEGILTFDDPGWSWEYGIWEMSVQ